MAETVNANPVASYIEKIEKGRERQLAREAKIRDELLHDENVPALDRALLGLSGSDASHAFYSKLAEKVAAAQGEPIVATNYKYGTQAKYAGGLISGEVEVELRQTESDEGISGAMISVPVTPLVTLTEYPSKRRRDSVEQTVYVGGYEDDRRSAESDLVSLNLISPIWRHRGQEPVIGERPYFEHMYIGREEIYGSPAWNDGISKLLVRMDQLS